MNGLRLSKLLILIPLILLGCDFFKMKVPDETGSMPLARVYDQYLYPEDLEGLTKPGLAAGDSAEITGRYIDNWIKQQLMLAEAASNVTYNEAELERKLLDYKYSLMVYEYEKEFVRKNLDSQVSQQEVEAFYQKNLDNFQLKQNIIKCIYVKIPQGSPKTERVARWVKNHSAKEKEELKSYTYRFATSYNLEDTTWINFEEIIMNTPLMSIPDKVQFLKKNKFITNNDDDYIYYLSILDYKIIDEISPIDFVRDQIKNIILNKRKVKLAQQLEQNIYKKASKDNDFEIYNND